MGTIRKARFNDMRKTGNKIFWGWVVYQTVKGTLTTSLIWVPLLWAWLG